MAPGTRLAGKLAVVSDFVQREPHDGEAATLKTVAYAAYDDKNLYAIFVCFDPEPQKIRSGISRREDVGNDDRVVLFLDTFHDQRRAYLFTSNAHGVQSDSTYSESNGEDSSWDAVWQSRGLVTKDGYVVWMAIPFKSVRFRSSDVQDWGILFERVIPRMVEKNFWPAVTKNTSGVMNKAAQVDGLERISPGRNMQFLPYVGFRASRSTDLRDPNNYRFRSESAKFDGGLDSKFVLKDSLVLDTTINPDFSQVESDSPQVMINNRFEVYVPEKRPFFLENTNFFETPLNLLFTRRIGDPTYGARLTGKAGKYNVGVLYVDDQEPGRIVPDDDIVAGKRAQFGVIRISRDILKESSIGMMYTDRQFEGASNRVGGADFRFKLHPRWVANGQAVASSTRFSDGTTSAGPAYWTDLSYQSRNLEMQTRASYISPGFLTETGYMPQTDVGRVEHFMAYRFLPKNSTLVAWGPSIQVNGAWDHTGLLIERILYSDFALEFKRDTRLTIIWNRLFERLRPVDFSALPANRDYGYYTAGAHFDLGVWRKFQLCTQWKWETRINYVPVAGQAPVLANANYTRTVGLLRPSKRLNVSNEYIWLRLRDHVTNASIFNNHIIRSRWNWQLSRELSLRFIGDYNTVLSNPLRTSLAPDKKFNVDFLVTYLLHPGTAVYVGYNSNLHNYDPALGTDEHGHLLRTNRFINDGRQLYAKISYRFSL
ncbi:MAG TPA: DUF5916 domain-containing protein [Terriglobales bacterium]|nr:DUF5916 domain-containing protein [Terriglobales bacterium]